METEVETPGSALDKRNGARKTFASNDKTGDRQRDVVGVQTEMDEGINTGGQENNTCGEESNASREEKKETGYNREKPPEDDCCPICFGEFRVPCKANCGHWFCGSFLDLLLHFLTIILGGFSSFCFIFMCSLCDGWILI